MALLEFQNIRKSFGDVEVLHGVSFQLKAGSVLALVGENGSGKSTSMNILGGIVRPSSGQMRLAGQAYQPMSPTDAANAGIAFIHQELNLFENLSIEENLFIGQFPRRRRWLPLIDRGEIRERAKELLQMVDIRHHPRTPVGRLSPGERQLVEIAKALSTDAKIIIFDEPTTSLTRVETERLFSIIDRLQQHGRSMIYISHILDDVFRVCDQVAVLRDGDLVGDGELSNLDHRQLVEMMVGRTIDQLFPPRQHDVGENRVLEVDGLTQPGVLKDVSLQVSAGEVVGISGLMGSGRTELARAIFGLDSFQSGTIRLGGKPLTHPTPRACVRQGMAFLTEDRRSEGLLMPVAVRPNVALASWSLFSSPLGFWVRRRTMEQSVDSECKRLSLRAANLDRLPVKKLSGGNQQKVVFAKWTLRQPRLLILDEPTRGIDIGARNEIYLLINQLVAAGTAVLMISSEIEELIGMCDRILVMNQGEIRAAFDRDEFESKKILHSSLTTREPVEVT